MQAIQARAIQEVKIIATQAVRHPQLADQKSKRKSDP
jgi:hypothetical protein